jgi:hypothetical protein
MTRMWRRAAVVALMALWPLAGCTGPTSPGPTSTAPRVAAPTPTPSEVPGGCRSTPLGVGALPDWTASAGVPGGVWLMSHEGNLVGVVFGHPLKAPPLSTGGQNKILWIAREPRNGSDLVLTLRPTGGGDAVTVQETANSGPGEIYPSIVDVPTPGCWQAVAEWAGHRATFELSYQPRGSAVS